MDPGAAEHLEETYRRAVYRARDGAGVWHAFTFDTPADDAHDDAARLPFSMPWALVTACNPMSVRRGEAENAAAMGRLREAVASLGLQALDAEGHDPGDAGVWREESVLVQGLDLGRATHLLRLFRQRAGVYAGEGRVGLLYADPRRWRPLPVRIVRAVGP